MEYEMSHIKTPSKAQIKIILFLNYITSAIGYKICYINWLSFLLQPVL